MTKIKLFYKLKQFIARKNEKLFVKDSSVNPNVSIISQNCIGGVVYHKLGMQFLSPTINMYFTPDDFLTFVENIEKLITCEPMEDLEETKRMGFPVLNIIDKNLIVKLYCIHYQTVESAIEKWNIRKKRINLKNLFVIMTDRDGFEPQHFKRFEKLPYKKLLYTAKKCFDEEVVFVKDFKNENSVGRMTDYSDFKGTRYFEKNFNIYAYLYGASFRECLRR